MINIIGAMIVSTFGLPGLIIVSPFIILKLFYTFGKDEEDRKIQKAIREKELKNIYFNQNRSECNKKGMLFVQQEVLEKKN
jgi:hypothetical protein